MRKRAIGFRWVNTTLRALFRAIYKYISICGLQRLFFFFRYQGTINSGHMMGSLGGSISTGGCFFKESGHEGGSVKGQGASIG
jgi:phosphoketolase